MLPTALDWIDCLMPWLKTGDNAALYPDLVKARSLGDERTVNELFGWLTRCMLQSAAFTKDYLVDIATVEIMAGARMEALIAIGKKAGLVVGEKTIDGFLYLELIADPEFMHMRLAAEIAAERQRKNDNTNPTVTAAVRLRDGDQCRWCGVVTWWTGDRKSGRAGTYDHLNPVTKTTEPATVATMIVACKSCNSARKKGESWDRPLLTPPSPPHYSSASAAFIAKHLGLTVVVAPDQRTGSQPVTAKGSGPASSRGSRMKDRSRKGEGDGSSSGPATGRRSRTGDAPETCAAGINRDPVDPQGEESGFTGSGRDGTGRDGLGTGLDRSARAVPGTAGSGRAGGRRSRRGRRRRSS